MTSNQFLVSDERNLSDTVRNGYPQGKRNSRDKPYPGHQWSWMSLQHVMICPIFSADFTRNQQWRTNFCRRWVKCGRSYEETQEYIKLRVDLKSYLWSLLYDASCKFHNMHCACCMMLFVPGRVFRMRYDEQYVCCVYNTICAMCEALRTSWEMVFTRCVTRTALRLPCVFPPKPSSSNLPS